MLVGYHSTLVSREKGILKKGIVPRKQCRKTATSPLGSEDKVYVFGSLISALMYCQAIAKKFREPTCIVIVNLDDKPLAIDPHWDEYWSSVTNHIEPDRILDIERMPFDGSKEKDFFKPADPHWDEYWSKLTPKPKRTTKRTSKRKPKKNASELNEP